MDGDGELTVTRIADATLLIRLGGRFCMDGGLVSTEPLDRALEEAPPPRHVRFESQALTEWDSTLVAVLERVLASCRGRGLEVDTSGLPAGAGRLLGLLEAAPAAATTGIPPVRASWVGRVGSVALERVGRGRQLLELIGRTTFAIGRLFRRRARCRREDILLELTGAGADALPIVSVVSCLLGMILAFVGAVTLRRFGASIYVADVVAVGMVRELGAVMTAIVMAGRTGSAYAAQLSTMNVTQETDALTTLGIDTVDFLVLPRMLALTLMMPLLYLYADLISLVGGGLVAIGLLGISPTLYLHESQAAVPLYTLLFGITKSAAFGVLVALAGCSEGMRPGRSAADVGRAATGAVVRAIVWIIAADGVFAVLFHLLGL